MVCNDRWTNANLSAKMELSSVRAQDKNRANRLQLTDMPSDSERVERLRWVALGRMLLAAA